MSDKNIKVAYGKINLKASCGTLSCWRIRPPFARDSAANTGKMGNRPTFSASTIYPSTGGGFTSADVTHPEGTVIMLMAARTRNGMRVADAVLFLRLRSSAAFLAIATLLPTDNESILGDRIVAFQGCADIVGVDEMKSMNIEVPRSFENNYMEREDIDRLFHVTVIRPESSPAPALVRIATSQGVKTIAMGVEAPRRLRLRRS